MFGVVDIVTIDQTKIIFDPASLADDFGKVFYFEHEVYRAIAPGSEELAQDILMRVEKWEKSCLVKTRKAPFSLKDNPLVFWHERIRHKNYCLEWLPEMLKDAAITFLNLNLTLMEDGFVAKDGHPWNIFFDNGRPVYIDVGSIVPLDMKVFLNTMHEFSLYFWLPLVLFAKQDHETAYEFLHLPIPNHEHREKIARTVGLRPYVGPRLLPTKLWLRRLIAKIQRLDVNRQQRSAWANYYERELAIDRPEDFPPKNKVVYDFLTNIPAGTLLDIGSNAGWFSRLAHSMGFEVISVDNDVPALTKLYQLVKSGDLDILPLYLDFSRPTPSHGLNNAYACFEERTNCDVVVAMAMVHHLTYKAKMSFKDIAKRISNLTKKFAVVEFIPKSDHHVSQWDQSGMGWYDRQNFINAFMSEFDEYRAYASSPSPREVFIFQKT